MPVSRKRKKKNGKSRPQTNVLAAGPGNRRLELLDAVAGLAEYRRHLDERRASMAAAAAGPMIADLVGLAANLSDSDLEDELCVRIGKTLAELDEAPIDDHVSPNTFADAVIDAAVNAVGTALTEATDAGPAWRVLTAAAGIVNAPLSERAMASIDNLRRRPGWPVAPERPTGPALTGPVLWTRDLYGSRFGVAAPIRTAADGPERWYLWDIDACGHDAFTVHSRYHATVDEALADWQAGVGVPAADGTVFTPADDARLLGDLLLRNDDLMRPGGENVEQFAEYHRSRRLAEAVIATVKTRRTAARSGLDGRTAGRLFAGWLRDHRPAWSPRSAKLEEVISELADSWYIGGPVTLYNTCSPHRVALAVAHIRDYYDDDFAADVLALLPDWVAWLADRNATPAHLADRARPYAHGEPHKGITDDDDTPNYLARVPE